MPRQARLNISGVVYLSRGIEGRDMLCASPRVLR